MRVTRENGKIAFFLGSLFVLMYVLNAWMPMYRDDYIAAVIWGTGDHLQSVQDVFVSLERYYFMHGGRLVSFFIQFIFLLYGKFWFNIGNAIVFTAMIVCLYFHVVRAVRLKGSLPLLMALTGFSWLGISHFGEIAIWMCGSAVYLWTGFFAALFLLPYNLQLTGRYHFSSAKFAVPMFLGGMVAACSVENLAVTTTLLAMGCSIDCWRRGHRTPWMLCGTAGALVGMASCLLAPGNFVRYVADQDRSLFFHFANQISANLEMLLYMLPVLLVLVLAWRILLFDLAQREGIRVSRSVCGGHHYVMLCVIVCFLGSFFYGGILAKTLEQLIVWGILRPLGLTDATTLSHFSNTMSGLEEVLIYWLGVTYVYLLTIRTLGLSKVNVQSLQQQIKWRMLWQAYPALHYAAFLVAVAILNNLFMLAAPSFPGRALFSSSILLILSAGVVLQIPAVRETLLVSAAGKCFRQGGLAITFFIMAATLTVLHAIWQEDAMRVSCIRMAAERQEMTVIVPPSRVPETQRVLRHIAYDDFDTGMTREEICAYFGMEDIYLESADKLAD